MKEERAAIQHEQSGIPILPPSSLFFILHPSSFRYWQSASAERCELRSAKAAGLKEAFFLGFLSGAAIA
jgi:hypothetical protein